MPLIKKIFVISLALLSAGYQAEAQLLEDTQKRLKTAKVRSRGFPLLKNKEKVRTASDVKRKTTKTTKIQYSPNNPFRGNYYKIIPKYSPENPFGNVVYKRTPKYSPKKPFQNKNHIVNPRYSNNRNRFLAKGFLKKELRYDNESAKWKGGRQKTHGNKGEPKRVNTNVRRPKFDKKEKDIWNN